MPLPRALAVALVERFVPVLCVDPGEPSYPVSPADYVEAAALWASTPPAHPRAEWGVPSVGGREPLIPRGGISLDPAEDVRGLDDPDGDGVPEYYLGQDDEDRFPFLDPEGREPWLDHGGWQDGDEVAAGTANRRARLGGGPGLVQPWFSSDVWMLEDLAAALGPSQLAAWLGLGAEDRPPQLERVVVLSFGFLFPGHHQPRRLTAREPAEDPWTGDYEGDWCHVSVVTRCEQDDVQGAPLEAFLPLHAAFGQRYRGTGADRDDHATERALLRPWSSLLTVGDHPVVVASAGLHNAHPHDPARNPAGTIDLQWVDFGTSVSEPATGFVQDAVEQPGAALFAAKVLAGAAIGASIGGPFGAAVGAFVGGLAAGAEAASSEESGVYDVPELEPSSPPSPPGEDPLSEDAVDLAKQNLAKPATVAAPPFFDPAQGEARDWVCSAEESLVDGSLVLDPRDGVAAFRGRWGVRCDGDPLVIRSGLRLPGYRVHVVDALLRGV
jgi:hypothetical protein